MEIHVSKDFHCLPPNINLINANEMKKKAFSLCALQSILPAVWIFDIWMEIK
jgi:hypothetical protein